MKRLALVLFVIALAVSFSQAQWVPVPNPGSGNIYGISFADTLNGWAVGDAQTILRTRDGGRTWQPQPQPVLGNRNFDGVYAEGIEVWIVGTSGWGNGPGIILYSPDSGSTWQQQTHPAADSWWVGIAKVGSELWVIGENHFSLTHYALLLRSSNGGQTWRLTEYPTLGGFRDISVVDSNHVWCSGTNNTLVEIRDNGNTFVSHKVIADSTATLGEVSFNQTGRGFVPVVSSFTLADSSRRTTDGGQTWLPWSPTPADLWLSGIIQVSQDTFYVGASYLDTRILRTTDGGNTYEVVSPIVDQGGRFTGSCRLDSRHMWMSTPSYLWYYEYQPVANQAPQFTCSISDSVAYIDSLYSVSLTAIDPDNDSLQYSLLQAPSFLQVDSLTGVISCRPKAGDSGSYTVSAMVSDGRGGYDTLTFNLKVDRLTGVEQIENNVPTQFSLSQNYPNPFNPQTTIEYSLAKSEQVSLKVYDMLGREAAELVSGRQSAGTYRASFNGTNLPSGMYICRLQSGDNVASKKMLLLK
jgi:photosystem II stability/assembly factor-like uncharacterized protein